MSLLVEKELACTQCQYPNKVEVWSILNVREDPELKDILLGGELNMTECVSCKQFFYAEHFLIYHDPDRQLMAFVYPFDYNKDRQKWHQKAKDDFAFSQESTDPSRRLAYEPLAFFGLDELVRFIEAEDESLIQGDVLEVLCQQAGIPVKRLRPALARQQKVPFVLPYMNGTSTSVRDGLLAGLKRVLADNDRLSVYQTFQKQLTESTAFDIKFD